MNVQKIAIWRQVLELDAVKTRQAKPARYRAHAGGGGETHLAHKQANVCADIEGVRFRAVTRLHDQDQTEGLDDGADDFAGGGGVVWRGVLRNITAGRSCNTSIANA